MYINTKRKEECCGCTACISVCPKNCLKMHYDEDGFCYPRVNDPIHCISCKLCEKVCPFNKTDGYTISDPDCYYGWMKEFPEREKSTSGGAFAAIAAVCKKMGVNYFYGAAYDGRIHVKHIGITSLNDLELLRRSKYVQSEMGNVYGEIFQLLKDRKKVLFSGTPCQVQGLINYVGTQYKESLITVALVCHGVGSPLAFSKYIDDLEKLNHSRVSSITFRDKKYINGELTHKCTTIKFENKTEHMSTDDLYTLSFGIGLINRPSCTECPFTTPYREADLSIGDFWGIEEVNKEFASELSKGISLILAHSEKGKEIINSINTLLEIKKVDLKYAINPKQQQLIHPMAKNRHRDRFMKKLKNGKSFIRCAKHEIFLYKCRRSIRARIRKIKDFTKR